MKKKKVNFELIEDLESEPAVMGGTHQRKQRKPRDAKREAAADGSEADEPNIVD